MMLLENQLLNSLLQSSLLALLPTFLFSMKKDCATITSESAEGQNDGAQALVGHATHGHGDCGISLLNKLEIVLI